jgi:hypothetical protein
VSPSIVPFRMATLRFNFVCFLTVLYATVSLVDIGSIENSSFSVVISRVLIQYLQVIKSTFEGKILRSQVKRKMTATKVEVISYNHNLEKIWKKGLIGARLR